MGKRKVPKNQTPLLATTSEPTKKGDETVKGKKTYSLPTAAKNYSEPDNLADLPKVQIPSQLENALIELILDEQKSRKNLGDISKRITSKKLSNVYNSLTDAGFSKNQVEAAMSATIACGGDLLDALDWLCLNTQNDQLPAGFSETLHKEEEKLRPKFDTTLQIDMKQAQNIAAATDSKIPIPQKIDKLKGAEQQTSVKDWVLSYAEQESEEESEEEETEETEAHFDPTGRYSVLHGEMLELKDQAAIAKSNNNQEQHKQLSKLLREIHLELLITFQEQMLAGFQNVIKGDLQKEINEEKREKAYILTEACAADVLDMSASISQIEQDNFVSYPKLVAEDIKDICQSASADERNSNLDGCTQMLGKNFTCQASQGERKLQETHQQGLHLTDVCPAVQTIESLDGVQKNATKPDAEVDGPLSLPEVNPVLPHKIWQREIKDLMAVTYKKLWLTRRSSPEYLELLRSRQMLPVFQYKEQLLCAIQDHNVVIIAGETGSGKSTQVPQFILEDCIDRGLSEVYVVCTQPRRISATSLAHRVSSELGENGLDQKEALVGYQIRFESHKGLNTRLLYSTTGVVLRQLQNNADLKGITHLIIDEVHERSVQSDYLMIVVKEILTRRSDLKCILMSATMDSGKFSAYFQHCPVISIPGKTFEVEVLYLEDVIEKTGYVVDEDSQYTLNPKHLIQEAEAKVDITQKRGDSSTQLLTWTKEDISKIDRTNLPAETYSLRTRNAVSRLKLDRINLDLIMDLLNYLEKSPPYCNKDGAVLIFLPGYSDIQELYEMLTSHRQFNNTARYQIYALHSLLSSNDQTKVFLVPPPGVRKIVLATNIAETGITIPDVVYVIDSGKAKENRYMESSQMSSLEEVFISKANCKQRTGRAGRVIEGYCFRLFTKEQFNELKPYTKPELLRVPLEELCLNIMKCQFGKPLEFLNRALDPPQTLAVSRAMSLLKEVGACYVDESSLTPLGHHLAALPVNIRIGKMLLLGSIFGCLEPIVSQSFLCDHITLYNAFKGWQKSKLDGKAAENAYISKHFLKKSTLNEIENVTRDLVKLVESIGFDSKRKTSKDVKFDDLVPVALIKAVLTAGMYPQVGQVITSPPIDTSEKSVCLVNTSQGVAQVHPSSVNRHLNASGSWMIYHEKVKVSQVYLRTTSIVTPYSLLLFGGAIDVQHTQKLVLLDSWIQFKAMAKTGVIFKEVRLLLNSILEKKLQTPSLNISDCPLIFLLKDLLRSEMSR
uniref:RNA helicase n=1 Tax=Biomphalaria glabrata TaxID=6526 RepID=A0A2C9JGM8_BIOGL